ncbi:MAG: lysylphosphatidylglycerol synthase transmembrane domain-containing protein [Pedobacter sp.]
MKKKSLFIVVALCILASLLIFIQETDLTKALELISMIGYRFYLLLIITFIAYLLGTLSWQYTLGSDVKKVSLTRLFLIRHVGETVAWFNPTSILGGDALKGMLLAKYDIDKKTVLLSVLVSRIIMILTQLLLLSATTCYLVFKHPESSVGRFSTLKLGALPFGWISRTELTQKLKALSTDVKHMISAHSKLMTMACGFALLHWLAGSLEFYFILKFLGLKVSLMQALLVDLGVILFKAAGAFIPGQLGVEEYGNKIMLLAIGIPGTEIWISASILRRARQIVWAGFGILVYFLMFHRLKPALQT